MNHPFSSTAALLALAVACQQATPFGRLEACGDEACRSDNFEPAWSQDRQATEAWFATLMDDTVQTTLLEVLALEHPREAADLCKSLSEARLAVDRCSRFVQRPHLMGPGKRPRPSAKEGSASGPRSTTLGLLEPGPEPWADADGHELQAAVDSCELDSVALCARQQARALAEEGQWERVGLGCLAGDPDRGKPYAECLFQSAEVMADKLGAAGVGDALRLCAWSDYGPMCVAHVIVRAAPAVPAAEHVTQEHVDELRAVLDAIEAAATNQPELGASYVDRLWASWTNTAFVHAKTLDGRLTSLLPEEARHHVPVAIAAQLVETGDPQELSLEELLIELEAVLARSGTSPSVGRTEPRRYPLVSRHRQSYWIQDGKGEHTLASAWVMGPGRRARVLDDPKAELRVCLLEAAGQLRQRPPAAFFLSVVGDPERHRLVRWTGARIGAHVDPDAAILLQDPDLLVQRALGTHRKNRRGSKPQPGPGAPPPSPSSTSQ